jgi:hypothetical protein
MSVVDAIAGLPTTDFEATPYYSTPLLNSGYVTLTVSGVPEPTTVTYLLFGVLATYFIAKKRKLAKPFKHTPLA